MTGDELAARRHADVLKTVARARKNAERAGEDLRAGILDAVTAGATHAAVAKAAGVSRARVSQIVGEHNRRTNPA